MKQTIEERAEAYRKDMFVLDGDQVRFDSIDIGSARYVAFKTGAEWQKEQSPWISIDERFPDDKEQVLVSSQIYGKVVLVWDKLGMVWVYPDDNDVYCDWDKVDCWMPIPE